MSSDTHCPTFKIYRQLPDKFLTFANSDFTIKRTSSPSTQYCLYKVNRFVGQIWICYSAHPEQTFRYCRIQCNPSDWTELWVAFSLSSVSNISPTLLVSQETQTICSKRLCREKLKQIGICPVVVSQWHCFVEWFVSLLRIIAVIIFTKLLSLNSEFVTIELLRVFSR